MSAIRVICFTILLSAFFFRAAAEDFTNAIHAYLQQRVEVKKRDAAIVVGIVDEHGSSIVSHGKMDNGTDQEVNGDTLFEIGSITKTFTALLLQDMIKRGEMKLDDPVTKYLPKSVKMPTLNGKEITLLQLVTHTSGLPENPDDLGPTWADYTTDQLYGFLSGYKLTDDPGARYKYSNLGTSLLGHAIALKAGTNYESLVVDWICRPLEMNSTRCALTLELKTRFTPGHNQFGDAWWNENRSPVFFPQGGLRSTANDLLKYMSAYLGLTRTSLTPLFEKTHEVQVQPGIPIQNSVLGSFKLIHGEENSSSMPATQPATAHLSVSTKRDIVAWWFCVLLPTRMMLTAFVLFCSKTSGIRTSGPRRQKSAPAFAIRLWDNTSDCHIPLPRPALGFAAKETVSSPKPQDQNHWQFAHYCRPLRVNYCRNRKRVFLED